MFVAESARQRELIPHSGLVESRRVIRKIPGDVTSSEFQRCRLFPY